MTVIRYQEYEPSQIERLEKSKIEFIELPSVFSFKSLFGLDLGDGKRTFITRQCKDIDKYLCDDLKYVVDENNADVYIGFESKIVTIDSDNYYLVLKLCDAYATLVGVVKAKQVLITRKNSNPPFQP